MSRAEQEQRIQRVRELADAATYGPWAREGRWILTAMRCWIAEVANLNGNAEANARLIAEMRTLGPALAEDLAAAHREIDQLQAELVEAKAQRNRAEQALIEAKTESKKLHDELVQARVGIADMERKRNEVQTQLATELEVYRNDYLKTLDCAAKLADERDRLRAELETQRQLAEESGRSAEVYGRECLALKDQRKMWRAYVQHLRGMLADLTEKLKANAEWQIRAKDFRDNLMEAQRDTREAEQRHQKAAVERDELRGQLREASAELEQWRLVSSCATPQDLDKIMERTIRDEKGDATTDEANTKTHTTIAPGTTGGGFGWCSGCRARCFVTANNRTRCCDRIVHKMPLSALCTCQTFAEERIGVMDCEGHKPGCVVARAPFYAWLEGAEEVPTGKPGEPLSAAEEFAKQAPVCKVCSDTHLIHNEERGSSRMCTSCPVPCQACRQKPQGPCCATTPCSCACHAKHEEARP